MLAILHVLAMGVLTFYLYAMQWSKNNFMYIVLNTASDQKYNIATRLWFFALD